jgi:hypothetical protein
MTEFLINHEMSIRLGFFFGVFAIIAAWEVLSPRRELSLSKGIRWANNIGRPFSPAGIVFIQGNSLGQ